MSNLDKFKDLLAQLHYLNHPYLSAFTVVLILFPGIFVIVKNPKSELHRAFFWITFSIAFWFLGNTLSMLNADNIAKAIFWYKFGYTAVPFMTLTYYNFYLTHLKKNKRPLYFILFIIFLEFFYLWFSKDVNTGAYALPNVGVVWQGFPRFSYFLLFGMIKYFIITTITAFSFLSESKKEAGSLKGKQFKFLAILFFFTTFGGSIEWLVTFDIPLHIAWTAIPIFTGLAAYTIIRYRAFEIDTVIHRTLLWALTVLLLILPVSLIISLSIDLLIRVSLFWKVTSLTTLLLIFLGYYFRLKPHIDHFFRRRKYDYHTALSQLPSKIGAELELSSLSKSLFSELNSLLYIQNSLLLVKFPDKNLFEEVASLGYDKLKDKGIFKPKPAMLKFDSSLIKQFQQTKQPLEKDLISIDPQYANIKTEAEGFFKDNSLELLIPIYLKDELKGLLGLGKKETLQTYTHKDIHLLEQLGLNLGISLDNALHHQDIVEKERLAEELRLGRDIQISLLPRVIPAIQGLKISGLMEPAKEIGGDYYDFLPKAEDRVAIVIGDVSGKGVAAGILMAVAKTAIQTISSQNLKPKDILLKANEILYQYMNSEKFMTMLYLEYNDQNKLISYSSAGHEHILHFNQRENRCIPIKSGGFMLGMVPDIREMLEEKEFVTVQLLEVQFGKITK
ncbi:MAG: SpoIIE family protein phosphatase [Candidatus Omnitrophica bacterium]|nr:SpoIIE family protein phosphatase [Candidatus Omnitrophota bacterium]